MGADPDQKSQSDQSLHRLLAECSIKIRVKRKMPPNNTYNGNGLVQLIRVGNYILLEWAKIYILKFQLGQRSELPVYRPEGQLSPPRLSSAKFTAQEPSHQPSPLPQEYFNYHPACFFKGKNQHHRATIGPLAKRHSNGVSLAGRQWPTFT